MAQDDPSQITLKEAAKIAIDYFLELFPDMNDPNAEMRLEEVEEIDDGKNWLITLGYNSPRTITRKNIGLFGVTDERLYKTFKIDVTTGRVLWMKIREV